MSNRKLTQNVVDRAEYLGANNKRYVIWDSAVSGFGLRVYPSGRKAYVLSYRHHGRKRMMTLGKHGAITADQARTRAKSLTGKVADDIDPLAIKQRAAAGDTVKELALMYMERHAKPRKKSWAEDQRMIDSWVIPAWGTTKAKAITCQDVDALHSKVSNHISERTGKPTTTTANRLLSLLKKMFAMAERWEIVPEGSPNPCRKTEPHDEVKRDRFVKPEEMPRLAEAIRNEANETAQAALWLYLMTGLRKSELLTLKWTDVDLDRKELRLGETKAGRIHYVPLSEPALDVLAAIPRIAGNPYVLVGRVPEKHLVNIDKPWRRVRAAAELDDVRLHDLRRTVGSWLAGQDGANLPLIGKVLNHSNATTTQIYARFTDGAGRKALDEHGRQIVERAGIVKP